jgi:hypothetical protein
MRALLPTGQLLASGHFLATVPRPAMIRALVTHCTSYAHDGRVAFSEHRHGRIGFHLVTAPDRSRTWMWLDGERG